MAEMRICPRCRMEFDWPGVAEAGEEFCCAECARGEPCSCVQHDHRSESAAVETMSGSRGAG